jgi:hypothetical protein
MTSAWKRTEKDRAEEPGIEDAWRISYRRIAPGMVAYLAAQGFAHPADAVVPLLLMAVRKLQALQADGRGLHTWSLLLAHRTVVRARRHHPGPIVGPSLLSGLATAQRDVLLLRLFGGLSHAQVAVTMRKRRRSVIALEREALHMLRDLVGATFGLRAQISEEDAATLIAGDAFPSDPALVPLAAALERLRTAYVMDAPVHIEDQHLAEIADRRTGAPALHL